VSRFPTRESPRAAIPVTRAPRQLPGVRPVKGQGFGSPTIEQLSCPVCGITLFQSDLDDDPQGDYYCPYCTTGQRPSRIVQLEPGIVVDERASI